MRKSKWLMLVLVGLLAMGLVAGCGGDNEPAPAPDGGEEQQPSEQSELSGSLQIAGSTSVQPLSEELATAFMDKYPQVTINVAGGGSGAGIKAAQEASADIGAASRALKAEEEGTVVATAIAYDGIAVVVHPSNPVSEITMEQIKQVFAGEITNWSELGGADAPITIYNREEGSGTRGAFTEIVLGEETPITDKAIIQNSNGAMRTAAAGDPNGIAYISFGYLNDEVKPLKVDGVEPTVDNVKNGSYKISRPFLYLTHDEPAGLTKAYMDFVLGDEGQAIVAEEFITVK